MRNRAPTAEPSSQPFGVRNLCLLAVVASLLAPSAASAGFVQPAELFGDARMLPYYEGGQMRGIQINQPRPGGFFDRIGVEDGQIILAVNGRPIDSAPASAEALKEIATADSLVLLIRDPQGQVGTIEFHAGPPPPPPPAAIDPVAVVAEIEEPEGPEFLPFYEGGQLRGARAREPDPRKPGLRAGDVILECDGRPIDSPAALEALTQRFAGGGSVELIFRDAAGSEAISSLKLP